MGCKKPDNVNCCAHLVTVVERTGKELTQHTIRYFVTSKDMVLKRLTNTFLVDFGLEEVQEVDVVLFFAQVLEEVLAIVHVLYDTFLDLARRSLIVLVGIIPLLNCIRISTECIDGQNVVRYVVSPIVSKSAFSCFISWHTMKSILIEETMMLLVVLLQYLTAFSCGSFLDVWDMEHPGIGRRELNPSCGSHSSCSSQCWR